MSSDYEYIEELAYVKDRAIKEGSVPKYLNENKENKPDINKFLKDIFDLNEKFMVKVDDGEISGYSPDDICEFIAKTTGYSTSIIETVLWFLECYQMANGFNTLIEDCKKCGHNSLYYREGPDGMYSYYFECEKCKEKYSFDEVVEDDYYDAIDFNEKLPMQKEIEIPLKDINEVSTSYIIKAATGYRKGIWRKIQISAAATLDDLSEAVLSAFDFDNDHLYAFHMDQKLRTRDVPTYYSPRCGYSLKNADRQMLENFQFIPKQKFLFLYDFGDEWHFTMTIEKIIEEKTPNAFVVQTRGESPLQYRYDNERDGDDDDDDGEDE